MGHVDDLSAFKLHFLHRSLSWQIRGSRRRGRSGRRRRRRRCHRGRQNHVLVRAASTSVPTVATARSLQQFFPIGCSWQLGFIGLMMVMVNGWGMVGEWLENGW